jgi:hypothetical protein
MTENPEDKSLDISSIPTKNGEISSEITPISNNELITKWSTFQLEQSTGFKQLDINLIADIEENSINTSLAVYDIFERLIEKCINGFDFIENSINFEDYLTFYQEINKLQLPFKEGIITADSYSSVYYVGDTHGAIEDSFLLIDFFLKVIRKDPKIKIIFLGDYVDRNPYDLENLSLIIAFYLLNPKNVILLRGNHEDRLVTQHYGFLDNILRTFYDEGKILFNEIMKFFTQLPIGYIDQMHPKEGRIARVFSVHGGIPINQNNFLEPVVLTEISNSMICEVEESKDMDPYTTSMLWSDPDEMIRGILTGDHLQGRIRFGGPVFNAFMDGNKLDLLIRGHQKWKEGCKTFFGGRLYSLFSTSSYMGKKKFNPKILKLEYGKSPKIISIEQEQLNMLVGNENL